MLEKIIAKRLGNLVLKNNLISPLHFGAIARRLAIDVISTLAHDIEWAWDQKEVLSALAFDIKGVFDTVTEKRLNKRLWEQKMPLPLIC